MICSRLTSFFLVAFLSSTLVTGFMLTAPSVVSSQAVSSRTTWTPPSTCLMATDSGENAAPEASDDQDTAAEEAPKATAAPAGTTDILSSPAFLKRKLEVLQNDLVSVEESLEEAKQRLQQGKEEWGPQLDNLEREYVNIQKRMSTQSSAGDTMSTVQVARQLLTVLDDYDRAFIAIKPENDEEKAIESEYKEAYDMVLSAFENMGVKQVETVGREFDYEDHQAVMQRPSDEYEEGIVCEELQKGFRCGDQLVRAAMVVVAA